MSLPLIYAAIPRVACKGLCTASCGPIMASDAEVRNFEQKTGNPFPDAMAVIQSESLACPRLNAIGQCDSYAHRPLVCRLWGVVDGMPCPHGCKPERRLTDAAAGDLFRQCEEL